MRRKTPGLAHGRTRAMPRTALEGSIPGIASSRPEVTIPGTATSYLEGAIPGMAMSRLDGTHPGKAVSKWDANPGMALKPPDKRTQFLANRRTRTRL
jgi:hypothetical protein